MRNSHSLLRLAVVIAVFAAMSIGAAAFAQDAITPGTPVEGEYAGNPIPYSLDLTSGQLLIVSMDSEAFDTFVRLTLNGEEIAGDDDGGDGLNALLAFVIPEDGSYEISAEASFFEDDGGPFTLTANVIDPIVVDVDGMVTLEPEAEGSAQLYAVFSAAAGDVVDIAASTTIEDEDIEFELYGVDGLEIDRDDDDGPSRNALLRRVVLPADGMYLITVSHAFSDELVTAPVELAVTAMEQLFLSAEPQAMVLGDDAGQVGTEVFTIDATAGTTYRIIVTVEPVLDEVVGVSLEMLDSDRFFEPTMEARHTTRVAWDFTANVDGTLRLDVHPNFFGRDIPVLNYTIAMEIVE